MPITIFFCYARKDEVLLNELKHHLRPLHFEYQEDAYHYLIRMVQDHGAKEAVLLQYSCHTSLPILRMLLRQGAKVTVFIQHEDTASPENGPFKSQLQAELIRDTTRNLRSNLGKILVEPGKLEVYKYRVQPSMSAIKIDNQVLCMGWYTFEQKRHGDDKANPGDTLDVSGHDRAAVVVHKGTKEFQALDPTFNAVEKNYREHAEIVPI